eukprot:1696102-Lingulodinium_polyedra.AAC.1
MASTMRGGSPVIWSCAPHRMMETGKRERACSAAGCASVAQIASRRCVDADRPAACPAARRRIAS